MILSDLEIYALDKVKRIKNNEIIITELRPSQKSILNKCAGALEQKKNILIQAPTGCGKTLVYSILASYVIDKLDGKVLIICPTKDLQRQVSETCHTLDLSFIEIYGSGEYTCPVRSKLLREYTDSKQNAPVVTLFCKHIKNCFYKSRGECTYYKSFGLAKKFPLIITNYNKYLESWDSLTEGEKFDLIIFDESHNLERIAEESSKAHISTEKIFNAEKYFKNFLQEKFQKIEELIPIFRDAFCLDIDFKKEDAIHIIGKFRELIELFKVSQFSCDRDVRVAENLLLRYVYACRNLTNALESFSFMELCFISNPEDAIITKLREDLNNFCIAATQLRQNYEFKGHSEKGYSEIFGEPSVRRMIRFILDRSAKMQCHVSATLGNMYDYSERIGLLEDGFIHCEITDYPFDLSRRILLGLIDGLSMNKYRKGERDLPWEIKVKEANKILEKLLFKWPGNTLIFFRSRSEAEDVYQYLSSNPLLRKRVVFKRFFNTGKERKELIEHFKNKKGSVLLGFGRMDQGLDLPGEYLTLIILYSLPFVFRSNQMQKDFTYFSRMYGSSRVAFEKVDLDIATKRLSQLIGRLIRTEDDFGAVIILDKRFYLRFYDWMKGRRMLPHYIDFKFVTTETACEILDKFWEKMIGKSYFEYIEESKINSSLEDFGAEL